MSTCNQLDLQTLGFKPVMPQISPITEADAFPEGLKNHIDWHAFLILCAAPVTSGHLSMIYCPWIHMCRCYLWYGHSAQTLLHL